VLVDLATNQVFELNGTGYRIWELVAEGLDRDAIGERLAREFEVERRELDRDVTALLDRLRDERLITESDEQAGPGNR
jgi:hypothetical protein